MPRPSWRHYVGWYLSVLLFGGLCALPMIWPGSFSRPLISHEGLRLVVKWSLLLIPVLFVTGAIWTEPLGRRGRLAIILVALAGACLCENIHYWYVDKGHYLPPSEMENNTAWQWWMHGGILRGYRGFTPHSYRFLTDNIVALLHGVGGEFAFGRIIYRITANATLLVVLFRYARTYMSAAAAAGCMLVFVAIYPSTIQHYAGQFVDPASHLTFVLCLFCLARRYEPPFGPALFLGVYAKESIIIMALPRAFRDRLTPRSVLIAAGYLVIAVVLAAIIRIRLSEGRGAFTELSGVPFGHVWVNIAAWYRHWVPLYLLTIGILVPGAVLGWRLMDRPFQWTCVLLVLAMVGSSALFSWMTEVRNLVPALFPLIVVNLRYAEEVFRRNASVWTTPPAPTAPG